MADDQDAQSHVRSFPSAQNSESQISSRNPYSCPYFLHAADTSSLQLVPQKLTGELNYGTWSRAIRKSLNIKNKYGFVTGKISKPSPDHPDYEDWWRCNDAVCTWLHNSVSMDIHISIVYLDEAHQIWKNLETRFKQQNVSKIFSIQQQLDLLHQGSMTLDAYYNKLSSLWEELRNYEPFPACNCGGCTCGGWRCGLAEKWLEMSERGNVVRFLMRLNDSYAAARRQILMIEPLPDLTKVFNLVSQEEKQRISLGIASDQDHTQALMIGKGRQLHNLYILEMQQSSLAQSDVLIPSHSALTISSITRDSCSIQDHTQALMIGKGRQLHNLYILEMQQSSLAQSDVLIPSHSALTISSIDLWHHRLGHPSNLRIQSLGNTVQLTFIQNKESISHCSAHLGLSVEKSE
ncbi:PREDICTED: uncharacterized protein LOC109116083 [Tarenaya hassleriana]|uniref:uncharacterized protein LOC109116083 n=1 Tax=Tarenaya hassleriana TaxID=28532 RepID=UPI0008FD3A8D|nr:PREDICTED: uncharacterized protein LOC109116083 [Tarenaya hassleriana]